MCVFHKNEEYIAVASNFNEKIFGWVKKHQRMDYILTVNNTIKQTSILMCMKFIDIDYRSIFYVHCG